MPDTAPDRGGDQGSVPGRLQCAGSGQRAAAGRVPHHAGGAHRYRLPGQRDSGAPFRNGGGGRANQACIEENSTTAQDQAAYLERYNGLAERYETAKAKLEKLQATKAQREAKSEDIGGFMFELAEYGDSITEFDDRLWLTVIDTVTVHRDGRLTFKFQTGHEITV